MFNKFGICSECEDLSICCGKPLCATESSGTQPTDVQQLKAEIAAIADTIVVYGSEFEIEENVIAVNKLRQLSAV